MTIGYIIKRELAAYHWVPGSSDQKLVMVEMVNPPFLVDSWPFIKGDRNYHMFIKFSLKIDSFLKFWLHIEISRDLEHSEYGTNLNVNQSSYLQNSIFQFLFILSFPFYVLYTLTIPPCDTEETRKWYLLSFTMAIGWIVAISFGMIWCVETMGEVLHINHFTMGLVIIAVGTSIPGIGLS